MPSERSSLTIGHRLLGLLGVLAVALGAAATSEPPTSSGVESFRARRARLEAMPPQERDRLTRNLARFEQLPAREQEQLRRLHEQLEQDVRSAQLREVMQSYQAWLKTLPASQRAELPQLSNEERIDRIKKWRADEQREKSRRLTLEDGRAFLGWLEKRVIAGLSEANRKAFETITNPRERREFIRAQMDDRIGRGTYRSITSDEIADLKGRLSPTAKQALADAEAEGREQLFRLLYSWRGQVRGGYDELRMLDVKREDLAKYFDTLSERDRDRLLALPPDEMWQRLSWKYLQERVRRTPGRLGSFSGERTNRQEGGARSRSDERGSERSKRGSSEKPPENDQRPR